MSKSQPSAIGYERFAEYASFDDAPGDCAGGGISRIWSPASRANCSCNCYEDSRYAGWLRVLESMLDPGVSGLFANARAVTGPLRLALIGYPGIMAGDGFTSLYAPVPWPLSRAPAANEVYYAVNFEPPPIAESSGVEISDPVELSALRATRDTYDGGASPDFTPLLWTDPDTQQTTGFHMVLRDELPAHVQAALERPLF